MARVSGRPEAEVLAIIRAAGIAAPTANQLVPNDWVDRIDRLLGIDRFRIPGWEPAAALRPPPETADTSAAALLHAITSNHPFTTATNERR